MAWSLASGHPGIALRLTAALWPFWQYHSHLVEGRSWLTVALDADQSGPDEADEVTDQLRGQALHGASIFAALQGDWPAVLDHGKRLLELGAGAGSPMLSAMGHSTLGRWALAVGDPIAAREHLETAGRTHLASGSPWQAAMATFNLAYVSLSQGDHARAREEMESARRAFAEFEDRYGLARALTGQAAVEVHADRTAEALAPLREALPMLDDIGEREGRAWAIELLGDALAGSRPVMAARLLGAAEALRTELGLVLVESEQEPHRRAMARLEHALDAGRLRHEWEAGSRLGLDAMTALALAASTPG